MGVHGFDPLLGLSPLYMGVMMLTPAYDTPGDESATKTGTAIFGVFSFAVVFAVNSAVHSYLVVKYSDGNKAAMNVGFYYMANAFGRLIGTITSGALYSYAGMTRTTVWRRVSRRVSSSSSSRRSWTYFVDDDEGGLRWGTNDATRCFGAPPWAEVAAKLEAEKKAAEAEAATRA